MMRCGGCGSSSASSVTMLSLPLESAGSTCLELLEQVPPSHLSVTSALLSSPDASVRLSGVLPGFPAGTGAGVGAGAGAGAVVGAGVGVGAVAASAVAGASPSPLPTSSTAVPAGLVPPSGGGGGGGGGSSSLGLGLAAGGGGGAATAAAAQAGGGAPGGMHGMGGAVGGAPRPASAGAMPGSVETSPPLPTNGARSRWGEDSTFGHALPLTPVEMLLSDVQGDVVHTFIDRNPGTPHPAPVCSESLSFALVWGLFARVLHFATLLESLWLFCLVDAFLCAPHAPPNPRPLPCGCDSALVLDTATAATFTVTAYWALQFHGLRELVCECPRSVPQSLAFCAGWAATGGKSGASFEKTNDERFVVKHVKSTELDMFVCVGGFTGFVVGENCLRLCLRCSWQTYRLQFV
jgi:hypothetical protein